MTHFASLSERIVIEISFTLLVDSIENLKWSSWRLKKLQTISLRKNKLYLIPSSSFFLPFLSSSSSSEFPYILHVLSITNLYLFSPFFQALQLLFGLLLRHLSPEILSLTLSLSLSHSLLFLFLFLFLFYSSSLSLCRQRAVLEKHFGSVSSLRFLPVIGKSNKDRIPVFVTGGRDSMM